MVCRCTRHLFEKEQVIQVVENWNRWMLETEVLILVARGSVAHKRIALAWSAWAA